MHTSRTGPAIKEYLYGTHRLCDPCETWEYIAPFFGELGITRLADVTGLDSIGIPVCMAVRPNSKSLSVSQGKGLTLMLARVSAAMESIEAYHAENTRIKTVKASYRELVKESEVTLPYELNLHPRTVYHEDLPLEWALGMDLIQNKEVYVPYDLIHLRFLYDGFHLPVVKQSSNGLASGNNLPEAISHGICEVVERDATVLWQLGQREDGNRSNLINLETIDSPPIQELLGRVKKTQQKILIWDQTSDVGIPCFGCVIVEGVTQKLVQPHGIFGGYGSHLSKEIAVIRAITEAAQARLTFISGARDDRFRSSYATMEVANNHGSWERFLASEQPLVDYRAIPSLETPSFEQDVAVELELLKKAGLDRAIVVDLTRPEYGIAVVRVIIPFAEFFYEKPPMRLGKRAWEFMLKDMLGS
jgi:ribosomal protein S12 methylthiotransferase accessory factor